MRPTTTAVLAVLALVIGACGVDDAGETTTLPTTAASAPMTTGSAPTTAAEATTPETEAAASAAPPAEPTTLDLAMTPGWEAVVEPLIGDVAERSDGAVLVDLDLEWMEAHAGPGAEQQIVAAVAGGEIALGLVGTRAFSELGVTSFDALTAPFLVDSYAMQQAIWNTDVPARMLTAVDELDVVGLTVAAGPLRRPLATNAPLLGPADFVGITFHTWRSPTNAATVAALGATHSDVFGDERNAGLEDGTIDATENGLQWVLANGRTNYATLNAAMWPATAVLIANPDALAALSDEQRDALARAAGEAFATPAELAATDAELVTELCDMGKRFADASAADLAALRDAVQPVHDALADDPVTAGFLDEIETLGADSPPDALPIPAGCTGAAAPSDPVVAEGTDDPSVLNGSYRLDWTVEELVAAGAPEDLARGNDGGYVLTLRDGSFNQTLDNDPGDRCPGTYAVSGNRITMLASSDITEWDCGGDSLGLLLVDAAWDLTDDQLVLSDFVRSAEIDVTWWFALYLGKPMSRTD